MGELIRLSRKAANEWRNNDAYYQASVLIDSLCDRLETTLSADVAHVVHGRWIVTEQENCCAVWNYYTCSVCGSVFDGNDWLFDEWKGCPVCLARMDGDGNG